MNQNYLEKEILEAVFLGISVQLYSTKEESQFIVLTQGMEALSEQNYMYVFSNINQLIAIEYAYQIASNLLEDGQIFEAFEDFEKYILNHEKFENASKGSLLRIFSI